MNTARYSKVRELQALIAQLPQFDNVKTTHRFANGMYARESSFPPGIVLVGRCHRHEHLSIVLEGELAVYSDDAATLCHAGDVFVTPAGTKRAASSMTGGRFMTVHRLPEGFAVPGPDFNDDDLARIEDAIFEPEAMGSLYDMNNRVVFDVSAFRALTERVIAATKPGTWSDWTPAQQQMMLADDWRGFSESRGYDAGAIAEYDQWQQMIKAGLDAGANPYVSILDLSIAEARRLIAGGVSEDELIKSGWAPHARQAHNLAQARITKEG